jgi:uncharacterized protein (TIGR02246 family)
MADDRKAIEDLMRNWREATARGDLGTVLGLMTDDAVFLRLEHEPMSREQFADIFRAFPAGLRIDAQQDIRDLVVSGDLAYAWTYLAVTMTPAGGTATTREGHVLTVFRRGADGRWLLARDANLLPSHVSPSHASS